VFVVNCSAFLWAVVIDMQCDSGKERKEILITKYKKSLYEENLVCSVDNFEEMIGYTTTVLKKAKLDFTLWEHSIKELPGIDSLTSRECGLGTRNA